MTCKRRLLPLLTAALLVSMNLDSSRADISATLKNPHPSVTIDEPGARKKVQSASGSTVIEQQRGREPPGSPVNLFMPDEFQFYTLNNNGQLVMKQMTKQEIQGMIAAGGTGLPVDMGHHQTKLPEGEPKVADVVQNVQNVLKGELSKPVPVHTSGSSSIPGSVNSQWTNMLPYILSGGTVDQQDIAQDTSMILPTLDDDQSSYVDVVPLQNGKPVDDNYEPTNYMQVPAVRPTLLGSMALDSGILGEQESYTSKRRPSRPSTTYPKFTTTRPMLDDVKNSSKPTLYIPMLVQPPGLSTGSQNKEDNAGVDMNKVPVYAARPSTTTKKTTTYNDGFTRLPMIQVPVIEADKLSTKSQQKTPVYEILPTISPITTTTTTTTSRTTLKDTYPSKLNIGPMAGFKKPSTGQRPTSSYRPIYEPITYRPVYEPSSRRPVYEPTTKVTQYPSTYTTGKASTASVYDLITKPSTKKYPETTIKSVEKEVSTTFATTETTFKLPEKTTEKVMFTVEPIKVEEVSETSTVAYYTTTEKLAQKQTVELTTNEVQYTTKEPETSATLRDSYEPIVTNKPSKDTYYVATDKPSITNKPEQTQSWIDSETTVQFVPMEETTVYQSTKYDGVKGAVPTTVKNDEYLDSTTEKEYEIPTVPPMLSEAISSIIGSIESKPMFYESVTYDVVDDTTIENKIDLTTEDPATDVKSTVSDYKETLKPEIQFKSTTPLLQQSTEPSKLADTTVYQKIETVTNKKIEATDDLMNKVVATTEMYIKKEPVPEEEEEVSTVKVIPIYDDDTSIYTLSSDSSTKVVSAITTKIPVKIETTSPSPSTETYTTQANLAQDTILPGLEETFNNYMKEHYDPKLATTGNYDDISHMTTFPTVVEKASSSDKNKVPILSETEYPKLDLTTATPYYESTEFSPKETTVLLKLEESVTANTVVDSETKLPETSEKNSVETPIIFLDVSSPQPEKEITKDNVITNSSLTRIKISNPVAEADKIILDAPIPTDSPSTVRYTLPSESKPANNIASGIIAGYPTYNEGKPITDYMSSSTENIKSSTETVKVKEEDKIVSYQKVQTTLLPEKTSLKTTTNIPVTSETTEYKTPETVSYESFTQIPFESLPIMRKPTTVPQIMDPLNDPPLEKISDLINQLQNSPADRNSIGYDNSNGIATTIVPLDRFETIMSSTPRDEILTTIIDNLSKTSAELQNTTYIVIQTLSPSKAYESSTEPLVQSTTTTTTTTTTTKKSTTTQRPSTTIADATTVVTVVKQPVTGRPYVASTYSTTKSSIEKIQSTIDKSAGRINLEEEKTKVPLIRPTEPSKFTMKNKLHYSTLRRPSIGDLHQTYTRKTTKPIIRTTTTTTTTTTTSRPIADSKESNAADKWTLIPQKVIVPDQNEEVRKVPFNVKESVPSPPPPPPTTAPIVTLEHAKGAIGLDQSNKDLDSDVAEFLNMCNELSFRFWTLANTGLSSSRSVTMSPFGMISTLAMIFLGARGLTSNAMNDILKLDDVVTFNPHLVFQNITDAVTLARGQGIENAAFVRALFADRLKVRKIMPFYKEQAQQFYEGAVVDINFSTAGDILRRRTNLLIRKQTGGRIKDFVKGHMVPLRSPLTALSANVFQTSCDSSDASSEGRDGEMYFAVSQTVKQRKLVPIPAVVWKSGVSAGYEPSLDATAVALGDPKRPVSFIMVMPGQQGLTAAGDNLDRLEFRLFGNPSDNALEKLLKVIIPRRVELQMPKFSQRSVINVTSALKRMGFDQLFTKTADLKGINGAGHDLYLAEMIQMNLFSTCGDDNKAGVRHLAETYPGTAPRHTRAWELLNNINNNNNNNNEQQNVDSTDCEEEDPTEESLESSDVRQKIQKSRLRWFTSSRRRRCRNKRQTEPDRPRMKMDKPFLYLIRHNLSGLILHMGRFNPKNQS